MSEDQTPVVKKRTAKSPLEAAQANADAAITQLENLGSRLFKLRKADLTGELAEVIEATRTLREKLN